MPESLVNKVRADEHVKILPGLNPARLRALERLGILTLTDLLRHYPRRHENRSKFRPLPSEESLDPMCLTGSITAVKHMRFGRRRIFEATLRGRSDGLMEGELTLRWFNLAYIHKLVMVGVPVVVYGRVRKRGRRLCMDHPEMEILEDTESAIHMGRIVPVHPATEGLTARAIRGLVHRALEMVDHETVQAFLPSGLDPMPPGRALHAIHFPSDDLELAAARRHLVLAEFMELQFLVAWRKQQLFVKGGVSHFTQSVLAQKFHASLPFGLTEAQARVIEEIRGDMRQDIPMNRLLQGDVGSGKTVVAATAILDAVDAGYQAAFMAPTQILAEQHYRNLAKWFEPLGVRVALKTGSRAAESGPLPLFAVNQTELPQVVVGTHALLYDSVEFARLGLVVIDEQHKFGVMQRAKLIERGEVPDVLAMTATPIPRTLAMSYFGDLEVSEIDQMPAGRGVISTVVRDASKLPEAAEFLKKQLEKGRQAYVVYPLIDESDGKQIKAAVSEFEKWRGIVAPAETGLLHGRMDPEEKDRVMERFRSGQTRLLVATTVIEVGIDVPNATVMLIENAERFGLAQLHQLRGRVGRGVHKSFCILLVGDSENADPLRLAVLEQTSDGFLVAEEDLRQRGAGDLLGTQQSGLPPLQVGDLSRDGELMRLAREAVQKILQSDPLLKAPFHQHFRRFVVENSKRTFSEVS